MQSEEIEKLQKELEGQATEEWLDLLSKGKFSKPKRSFYKTNTEKAVLAAANDAKIIY